MYRLNSHLLTRIYEYDNTYKELLNVILTEMKLKSLINPSLNSYDTAEWTYRISKWKQKVPTQVHIPTIKYKHLPQIECNDTLQKLIDAIIYKANTYKEDTLFSIIITTPIAKYSHSEATRRFKVLL